MIDFQSFSDVSRVVSVDAGDFGLRCRKCGDFFEDSILFAKHMVPLRCRKCGDFFEDSILFAKHMVQCQTSTRRQMEKNMFMISLNLIPKQIHEEISKQTAAQIPPHQRHFHHCISLEVLSRVELQSELGCMLHQNNTISSPERKSAIRQYESRCVKREGEGMRARVLPFENIYRPIRNLKNNAIDYCYTTADRKESARRKKALKQRARRECKECQVRVTRLSKGIEEEFQEMDEDQKVCSREGSVASDISEVY